MWHHSHFEGNVQIPNSSTPLTPGPSYSPNGPMLSRGLQNDVNQSKLCRMEAEWLKEKHLKLSYIGKKSLLVVCL